MFTAVVTSLQVRAFHIRSAVESVIEDRAAGRPTDEGIEAIEVVVLSVVALGIVVALGALLKTFVLNKAAGLG